MVDNPIDTTKPPGQNDFLDYQLLSEYMNNFADNGGDVLYASYDEVWRQYVVPDWKYINFMDKNTPISMCYRKQ